MSSFALICALLHPFADLRLRSFAPFARICVFLRPTAFRATACWELQIGIEQFWGHSCVRFFQGAQEPETGTVGTVFPETESGTRTTGTVFPETETGTGTVHPC